MRSFKVDKLEVRVAGDRAALGQAAAEAVCGAISEVLRVHAVANVMFAAAPSQNEFLAALVGMPVDWPRVNGFHMDEYIGLDEDAPQGFGNFLRERLFSKVPFGDVSFMRPCENMRINWRCSRWILWCWGSGRIRIWLLMIRMRRYSTTRRW
jgi:glucosamine-6-phosphate deaminase